MPCSVWPIYVLEFDTLLNRSCLYNSLRAPTPSEPPRKHKRAKRSSIHRPRKNDKPLIIPIILL